MDSSLCMVSIVGAISVLSKEMNGQHSDRQDVGEDMTVEEH
jgi:hypothetical protein